LYQVAIAGSAFGDRALILTGGVGDGTAIRRLSSVRIMDDVVAVSAGDITIAVRADGSLWSWGTGWLGDGSTERQLSPIQVMENAMLP